MISGIGMRWMQLAKDQAHAIVVEDGGILPENVARRLQKGIREKEKAKMDLEKEITNQDIGTRVKAGAKNSYHREAGSLDWFAERSSLPPGPATIEDMLNSLHKHYDRLMLHC